MSQLLHHACFLTLSFYEENKMPRKNPIKCVCPICEKEYYTLRPCNPPRCCSKECGMKKRHKNYMENLVNLHITVIITENKQLKHCL